MPAVSYTGRGNKMTYGEIYEKFRRETGIADEMIVDYRQCTEPYYKTCIPNTIIVWLKNGDRLIYIHEEVAQ
jgi:hypothetical protein